MRLISTRIDKTREHVRLVGRVLREASRPARWPLTESMFVASEHGKELELYFEFPRRFEGYVTQNADPFAAAMLLPSMAIGEPLEIDVPVSDLLLFNLAGIQDAFTSWYPEEFQRIRSSHRSAPFLKGRDHKRRRPSSPAASIRFTRC